MSQLTTQVEKKPTKVMFFGTHPCCYNGYCLITYNLAKELALKDDIEISIFGFQNFYANPLHIKERTLPTNVYIYDAHAMENPKHLGFGFDQVKEVVSTVKPDVLVIYNDMVVVSNILGKLREIPNPEFKIIVYIDQVYLYQKPEYIKLLNQQADYVMCFTKYWEGIAKDLGITKPTGFLQHGFDPMVHYPVPKPLARQYFGLKRDDFIIMNLNRNQPRKRWDICLMAFAEVVSRHLDEPIKLLIATAVQGAWNLLEVYERELKKRGITMEEGMKHIILIDNPQQLTDEDINILYNVANIGINTCDGEGFGLCNFQQAAIGIPQIVPKIGGFLDFFNKDNAIVIEPKFSLYIDTGRDGVGGESQLCDWLDFADAIDELYANQEDMAKMASNARKNICDNYKWSDIGNKFYNIIKEVYGQDDKTAPPANNIPLALIEQWATGKIDASENVEQKLTSRTVTSHVDDIAQPTDDVDKKVAGDKKKKPRISKKPDAKTRLKEKLAERQAEKQVVAEVESKDKEELLALKSKIDQLLQEKDKPVEKEKKKSTRKSSKKT